MVSLEIDPLSDRSSFEQTLDGEFTVGSGDKEQTLTLSKLLLKTCIEGTPHSSIGDDPAYGSVFIQEYEYMLPWTNGEVILHAKKVGAMDDHRSEPQLTDFTLLARTDPNGQRPKELVFENGLLEMPDAKRAVLDNSGERSVLKITTDEEIETARRLFAIAAKSFFEDLV